MKWIGISSFTTRRRRGFSLVELSIVLGVAAIILGGIWGLAGMARETSRQSTLSTDLTIVVKNIRALYGAQNGIPQPGVSGLPVNLTAYLGKTVSPPVFPGDMLRPNGTAGCTAAVCVDHPWALSGANAGGGSLTVCAWDPVTTACVAGPTQFFIIMLTDMPVQSCINAAMNNAGANAPAGLYDVAINNTSIVNGAGVTHQMPPKLDDIQRLCTANGVLGFVYRLVAPQT